MLKLLLALMLVSALLTSYALADDDWDGQTNVIRADVAHAEGDDEAAARDSHPAKPAAPADRATMGSFMGTGDQFNESGVPDSAADPGAQDADHQASGGNPAAGQPEGDVSLSVGEEGDQGYLTENVFGPMWGVPEDAQGLDEFRTARSEYQRDHPNAQHDGANAEPAANDTPPAANAAEPAAKDGGQAESAGETSDDRHRVRGAENHKINRDDPNDW